VSAVLAIVERPAQTFARLSRALSMRTLVLCLLSLQAVALVPWLFAPGAPMDEGGILAYAGLVYRGYLPMRTIRAFYGPLNSYLVGGVMKLVGSSLDVERLIGLGYRLLIAVTLLSLARRRGRTAVVAAAGVLMLLPPGGGISASASRASLGCCCLAVLFASDRRVVAAGCAAGVAVLLRYDFVLPVAASAVPWLVSWRCRRLRIAALGAFLATAGGGYAVYVGAVGIEGVRVSAHLLRIGESARRLPFPPLSTPAGTLLALSLGAILVLGTAGWRLRGAEEGLAYLSVALLSIALLPYVLGRADRTHVLTVALPSITLAAAALPAAVAGLGDRVRTLIRAALTTAIAGVAMLMLVYVVRLTPPRAYDVSYGGRSFLLANPRIAHDASLAVARADALAPPGGRLFVGPGDLRRTVYDDAYLYYLLPRLKPATFFITLDPGVTVFPPHELSAELPQANVIILDRLYDTVTEPNSSRVFGSPAPNTVVRDDFCRRGRFGPFLVFLRCVHESTPS
jgi:hypothetical protein